jgi:hypothetical protein
MYFHKLRYKSQLLQGWLADQNEVELIDWPPCWAVLNPIENVWAEKKRVTPKTGLTYSQFRRTPYGMLF